MLPRVKKYCDGCRALAGTPTKPGCNLGFKVRWVERLYHTRNFSQTQIRDAVPQERCPKPRTWKEYQRLKGLKESSD